MVSRRCRNTSLDSGGCVDIVASGEEGAGASSAVGQAPAVHGLAGSGVECARRGSRSRCVPFSGNELGAWLQDLPQRCCRWFRPATGSVRGQSDQPTISVSGRTYRDRQPPSFRAQHARDRRPARSRTVDDFTGTGRNAAANSVYLPFAPIVAPPHAGLAITGAGSIPMPTSGPWSPSYSSSDGAHSRSVAIYGCASSRIRRFGCAMRACIRLSIKRIRHSCDRPG